MLNKSYIIEENTITIYTHMEKFKLKKIGKIDFSKNNVNDLLSDNNELKEYKKGVYCFVYRNNIIYIGKSDKSLKNRINQYLKNYDTQETNKRVKEALSEKKINLYFISENEIANIKNFKTNYETWHDMQIKLNEYKNKRETLTINRFTEIILTGYCWNKKFLAR